MARYETIWERKTANFRVALAYTYDDAPDLSWDETGETRDRIQNGEWGVYVFRVAVYDASGHEIAADYLGSSIHADPAEFIDHRACGRQNREWAAEGKPGRCGSYFRDMIATACQEARREYNRPRAFLRVA